MTVSSHLFNTDISGSAGFLCLKCLTLRQVKNPWRLLQFTSPCTWHSLSLHQVLTESRVLKALKTYPVFHLFHLKLQGSYNFQEILLHLVMSCHSRVCFLRSHLNLYASKRSCSMPTASCSLGTYNISQVV